MRLMGIGSSPRRRDGFTLVELLVVISIIAILTALFAAGIITWRSGQQRRNSENNIRTAYKLLQQQWGAVIDDAKKEDISGIALPSAPDPTNERARLIWIKLRLMEAFPMSLNEALNPPALIPVNRRKYVVPYTRIINARNAAKSNATTEAGACLAMALSVSHAGKSVSQDDLGYIALDTDGDGMKEVVDGFQQAVNFDRFGTSEPGLQAANPAPPGSKAARFADPLDPSGLLLNPAWYKSGNRITYELSPPKGVFGYAISPDNGNSEFYVLPVIFSSGPDNNPATTADNIYSFNLR